MYFKTVKGSEANNNLLKLLEKIRKCNSETMNYVDKKFPDNEGIAIGFDSVAGGISAIVFEEKPDDWKYVSDRWTRRYYPKKLKKNKELIAEFEALETVSPKEMREAIGFTVGATGITFHRNYGFSYLDDEGVFLLSVSGQQPKLKDGLVEILESEYLKLKDEPTN